MSCAAEVTVLPVAGQKVFNGREKLMEAEKLRKCDV